MTRDLSDVWRSAAVALVALVALNLTPMWAAAQPFDVCGATVELDTYGIPHITGDTDHDVICAQGFMHARDRLFQMDVQRRLFSGRVAELLGPAALAQDVQLRTLGLRRAAEASAPAMSAEAIDWMQAYAEGINLYLGDDTLPLPPEYGALEITRASIPPWSVVDSLTVAKGLAFGLSFDLDDIDRTIALLTFQAAGAAAGFDGTALFFEDLYRTAPFDPAVSIPEALPKSSSDAAPGADLPVYLGDSTVRLIEGYREKVAGIPLLERALDGSHEEIGSNWWVTAGSLTDSGYPILANDPHLALDQPAVFYEIHLAVTDPARPMEVYGVSFPGAPIVAQGCTPRVCWGSTVHPMDVTDVYQERIALNPSDQLPMATYFDGSWELILRIRETFMVNQIGDGTTDNLVDARVPRDAGGLTFVVPRRNFGPILQVDSSDLYNITGLSVQYTGWGPTREIDAFRIWARAGNLDDFRDGLQYFDVGSQNWSYADVDGNIAYFTSAELPLREDLQTLMSPDGGVPPYIIRDGTHQLQHEWMALANPQPGQSIGFEILPYDEMPQLLNPDRGFILNANNDPVGTSLDNNPLNQVRPGGGLYYLSPGYARGFRMGRLQRLYDDALGSGALLDVDTIKAFQANNQLLDAEFFAPLIVAAFDGGAVPPGLNPNLADAVGYLRGWDFSTPTGIPEGYDPGDDPTALPAPDQAEIDASVAASIYSAWRGQMLALTVDAPLQQLGISSVAPPSDLAMTALRTIVERFPTTGGVGASGLPFVPGGNLDAVMLTALSNALDLLASDTFAGAFGNSTNLADYRWGRLHRIVFDSVLGGPFSIPTAGGLSHLSPELRGVARSGGFGALDASSHSARADGLNEFMFGSGPARRFVGHLTPAGVEIHQTVPGGASGVIGSPHQSDALMLWLTNRYHSETLD